MPPSAARIQYLGQVATTYFACVYTCLIFDLLITFKLEYARIWKASWSPIKVLFLFNRYWTIITLGWCLVMASMNINVDYCDRVHKWEPGTSVPIVLVAGSILTIRAYAMSGRSIAVLICLLFALTCEAVIMLIAVTFFVPVPINGTAGPCISTGPPGGRNFTLAYWFAPIAFDITVTTTTFVYAWRLHKRGLRSNVFRTFLWDQGIYFLGTFCVNLLNVIFYLQPDSSLQTMNSTMALCMTSLLATHLILSLRDEDIGANNRSGLPSANQNVAPVLSNQRYGRNSDSGGMTGQPVYPLPPLSKRAAKGDEEDSQDNENSFTTHPFATAQIYDTDPRPYAGITIEIDQAVEDDGRTTTYVIAEAQ